MIVPKRNAAPADRERDLMSLNHLVEDFLLNRKVADHGPTEGVEIHPRAHYHVFSLQSLCKVIEWCNHFLCVNWRIEEVEESDSKVGNGHTIVARYLGPVPERPSEDRTSYLRHLAHQLAVADLSDGPASEGDPSEVDITM